MRQSIAIDGPRFLRDFARLAEFGATPGGLNREAGSASYKQARDFLRENMEDVGMVTRLDAAGNLFGVLSGSEPGARKLLSGSHLDSVTNGGIYDGPLGIMAAIASARAMRDAGYRNRSAIEVAAWCAEEGGPLGGTFGSRAFAGQLRDGSIPPQVLDEYGMDMPSLLAAACNPGDYLASVELHIEQGPVLWNESVQIGIPEGIVGISRCLVQIAGAPNHAGTTPMPDRRDAVQAAVRILGEWFDWVLSRDDFVCNVGTLTVPDGHVSIVPAQVAFPLEIRALRTETIRDAAETFRRIAAAERTCRVTVWQTGDKPPVALDRGIADTIAAVCREMGASFKTMPSGASHDSSPIAHIMPAGMIFVPSKDGISHSPEEFTPEADMIRGANCLLKTLLRLDAG